MDQYPYQPPLDPGSEPPRRSAPVIEPTPPPVFPPEPPRSALWSIVVSILLVILLILGTWYLWRAARDKMNRAEPYATPMITTTLTPNMDAAPTLPLITPATPPMSQPTPVASVSAQPVPVQSTPPRPVVVQLPIHRVIIRQPVIEVPRHVCCARPIIRPIQPIAPQTVAVAGGAVASAETNLNEVSATAIVPGASAIARVDDSGAFASAWAGDNWAW